jgi:hypothetical protein
MAVFGVTPPVASFNFGTTDNQHESNEANALKTSNSNANTSGKSRDSSQSQSQSESSSGIKISAICHAIEIYVPEAIVIISTQQLCLTVRLNHCRIF